MPKTNKKHQNSPANKRKTKAAAKTEQPQHAASQQPPRGPTTRPPDRTPRHLIGDYGMPLQVSLAWVSHNSGRQLGLVPIPNRKEGWRMTHARYRPGCSCWPQQKAGGKSCPHKEDSSILWTLEAFIG